MRIRYTQGSPGSSQVTAAPLTIEGMPVNIYWSDDPVDRRGTVIGAKRLHLPGGYVINCVDRVGRALAVYNVSIGRVHVRPGR